MRRPLMVPAAGPELQFDPARESDSLIGSELTESDLSDPPQIPLVIPIFGLSLEKALKAYAGIGDEWPALTQEERQAIESCGDELGLSDLFNARAGLAWGWSDCEGGHHTSTQVPVFATGPGAGQLNDDFENTDIGDVLLDAVSGH